MKGLSKKKTKVLILSFGSILLASILAVAGIGVYFKLNKKDKAPKLDTNPLSFSIDTWDGSTVEATNFKQNYAGRGDLTKTINSASSFVHFINEVNNGKSFEGYRIYLNSNIDLKGNTIKSIGTENSPFKGTFDGGYYTILNANIKGTGLFGVTENATIENVGLYNATIESKQAVGLIGKAVNTDVSNTYVRLGTLKSNVGVGLIGEYISNNGEHYITNSFIDTNNTTALIHKLDTDNSSENQVSITYCYNTQTETVATEEVGTAFTYEEEVIKATNKSQFSTWSYSEKYSDKAAWCDYTNREGSLKLDFTYPIQSNFVKVYTNGSAYEGVLKAEGSEAQDIKSLSEAFKEADKVDEAEINLLVDKIFMDSSASITNNTTVKINALKDTTIVRSENNNESMFVGSGSSKIVIGSTSNMGTMSTEENKIVIDGNKDYVEANELESDALIKSYGGEVEIHSNVEIRNNVNTTSEYGGAVLLYNTKTQAVIEADIENCHAAKAGGGICAIGTMPAKVGSFKNCSAEKGGAIAYMDKVDGDDHVSIASSFGFDASISPMDGETTPVTSGELDISGLTFEECYNAIHVSGSGRLITGTNNAVVTFYGNHDNGAAIWFDSDVTGINEITYAVFNQNNYSGADGGSVVWNWSSNKIIFGEGVAFSNNGDQDAGGSAVYSAGDVECNGVNFEGNTGYCVNGGAICSSGAVTLNNCVFKYNGPSYTMLYDQYERETVKGGAVYAGSRLIANDCVFENNYSDCGGAIYAAGADAYITNCVFKNNRAEVQGGAIYSKGTLEVKVNGTSETNLANNFIAFKGNKAQTSDGIDKTKYPANGGAIYCERSVIMETANVEVSSSADNDGGLIYALGTVTMTDNSDSTISDYPNSNIASCTAGNNGGAIYAHDKVTIRQTDGNAVFGLSTAKNNGGFVYGLGEVEINNAFLTENGAKNGGSIYADIVTINSITSMYSSVSNNGGAIFGITKVIINDGYFWHHAASNCGGAIYCEGETSVDKVEIGYVEANIGGAIYSNSVEITGSVSFDGCCAYDKGSSEWIEGGAIWAGYINFSNSASASFSNCSAVTDGGAIYCHASGDIYNATFTGNSATNGGAVFSNEFGEIDFYNCKFTGNTATNNGGAVYINRDVNTTSGFQNTVFKNNTATNNGGAVYANQSILYMANASSANLVDGTKIALSGNSALNGGSFYSTKSVSVNATKCYVESHASINGKGGIIYSDGSVYVNGSKEWKTTLNEGESVVSSMGGMIYANGNLDWKNVESTISAGAYFYGVFYVKGKATIDGGNITSAGGRDTGLLYAGGDVEWTNANNISSSAGSCGMICSGGNVTFSGGKNVSSNAAGNSGGLIYAYNGNVTMNITVDETGTISSLTGSAFGDANGGLVYSGGNVTWNVTNTSETNVDISSHTALGSGGLIYATGDVTVTNSGAISYKGYASQDGGLIYAGGKVKISGAATWENTNTAYGGDLAMTDNGGIVYAGGDVEWSDVTTIKGNSNGVLGKGGAIYSGGNVTLSSTNANSVDISANSGDGMGEGIGGVIYAKGDVTISFVKGLVKGHAHDSGSIVHADGNVTITGGQFVTWTNTLTDRTYKGGIIYAGGNVDWQYCWNVTSSAYYGGIVYAGGKVEIESFSSIDAHAVTSGGLIYAKGNITINEDQNEGVPQLTSYSDEKGGLFYTEGNFKFYQIGYPGNSNGYEGGYFKGTSRHAGGIVYAEGDVEIISGDFITFTLEGTAHTGDGGAIYAKGRVNVSYSIEFNNCSAMLNGGAIYADGLVNLNGVYAYNCSAAGMGGVAYSKYAIGLSSYGVFENNQANYGGVFYAPTVSSIGADYKNNTANVEGGAIWGGYVEVLEETYGEPLFKNNTAQNGGAIYGYTTVIEEGVFDGNTATQWSNPNEYGFGGAIYAHVVTVNAGTFKNNTSVNHGGAIQTNTATIGDVTFTNNSSSAGSGGAVNCNFSLKNMGEGTYDASSPVFTGNKAAINGGAICVQNTGSITLYCGGPQFTGNEAKNGGALYANIITITAEYIGPCASFSNNKATTNGGAIDCTTYNGQIDAYFSGNSAGQEGGAIRCENYSSAYQLYYYEGGNERYHYSSNSAQSGGAIYAKTKAKIYEIAEFYNNTATIDGGAVWADELEISGWGVTFTSNTAETYGGAVYAKGVLITGDPTFTSNTSDYGGAVYAIRVTINSAAVFNNNTAEMEAGAIWGAVTNLSGNPQFNSNSSNDGGAIFGYTITVNSATFDQNSATRFGGAIYCGTNYETSESWGGKLIINASTFTNNSATNWGGAFCGGDIDIYGGSTFTGNTSYDGGVGYGQNRINVDDVDLDTGNRNGGSLFEGNTATHEGGVFRANHVEIGDSTFRGNGALVAGGVVSAESVGTYHSPTFEYNTACYDGGAIYANDVTIYGVPTFNYCGYASRGFANNTSLTDDYLKYTQYGGAIFGRTTTIVDNATFTNCGAEYGGAIHGTNVTVEAAATFDHNMSVNGEGASIWGINVTLKNNPTLTNGSNHMDMPGIVVGGAIYGYTVNVYDATISNNQACSAGAIYGHNVTFQGTALIENNTAQYEGGAIVATDSIGFGSSNVTIRNNSAGTIGGAIVSYASLLDTYDSEGTGVNVVFENNRCTGSSVNAEIYMMNGGYPTLYEYIEFKENTYGAINFYLSETSFISYRNGICPYTYSIHKENIRNFVAGDTEASGSGIFNNYNSPVNVVNMPAGSIIDFDNLLAGVGVVTSFAPQLTLTLDGDFEESSTSNDYIIKSGKTFTISFTANCDGVVTVGVAGNRSGNAECEFDFTSLDVVANQTYTKTVKTSGEGLYNVELTLTPTNQAFSSVYASEYVQIIGKTKIDLPIANTTLFTYNGEEQTYYPANWERISDLVVIHDNTRTDAGSQLVTIELANPEEYIWADDTSEAKQFVFEILPAKLATPTGIKWQQNSGHGSISDAKWNTVPNTTLYLIQLFKNGVFVDEIYSFSYIEELANAISNAGAGEYTFKVKAVSESNNFIDSDFSIESGKTYARNIIVVKDGGISSATINGKTNLVMIVGAWAAEAYAAVRYEGAFDRWSSTSNDLTIFIGNSQSDVMALSSTSTSTEDIIVYAHSKLCVQVAVNDPSMGEVDVTENIIIDRDSVISLVDNKIIIKLDGVTIKTITATPVDTAIFSQWSGSLGSVEGRIIITAVFKVKS